MKELCCSEFGILFLHVEEVFLTNVIFQDEGVDTYVFTFKHLITLKTSTSEIYKSFQLTVMESGSCKISQGIN